MQDIQMVKAKFGERMRYLIEAQGWTIIGFCKTTGISYSLFYKYVNGETEPGVTNLLRIAEALKVSADCLLGIFHTLSYSIMRTYYHLLSLYR